MLQCDHPARTSYYSSLGAVHAHGGAEGWSAARQRAWKADDDGGRGTGVPVRQAYRGTK
jgi:hypothetical protein